MVSSTTTLVAVLITLVPRTLALVTLILVTLVSITLVLVTLVPRTLVLVASPTPVIVLSLLLYTLRKVGNQRGGTFHGLRIDVGSTLSAT